MILKRLNLENELKACLLEVPVGDRGGVKYHIVFRKLFLLPSLMFFI